MRWLALTLVLSLASVVHAQDVDAGIADAGEIIPDSGVNAAPAPPDEAIEEDTPLPEGHEAHLTLALTPDHDVMTGDVVTATITVTLTEGDDVAVPRQELGTLELHDQRHHDAPDGTHRVFTFELDFLMLEPGDQDLPPIRLRVVTADGEVGTLHTEAATIHVGSLIANEPDAQPRAATTPIPVMQDDYTLAYVLGALGLVALGALIAWLVLRWYRRQPKVAPPPPPARPAWELALEKIEALRKRLPASLADNKQVEVVDGVSDALREYLGARFDFNGLESTSDEVIARMRHQRLGPIAVEEIIALLGDADLVKFAKAVPDEETCKRMIDGTVRIVRGTMTVAAAPAITQPARPAGERTSKAPKKKAPSTGADDSMIAKALEAQAAASAAVRDDGRREVPDTNPPAAPKVSAEAEPSPQPSSEAGEGAEPTSSSSPWRESKATPPAGTRDPNDKDGAS